MVVDLCAALTNTLVKNTKVGWRDATMVNRRRDNLNERPVPVCAQLWSCKGMMLKRKSNQAVISVSETTSTSTSGSKSQESIVELGNGSQVVYIPRLIGFQESWKWFDYLHTHIPWNRHTIRVFGRSCIQPRDTCYIANAGLPHLAYSGYQPHSYSWDDFRPLKDLLQFVHNALPGSHFNSLLLNRYKSGNDYVGWHSDDEKIYGPTPEISSLSFGCERDFTLKKKSTTTNKLSRGDEPTRKRLKKSNTAHQHSFTLKHGSLLVMRGFTQRDWIHSVPKRGKVEAVRVNLTFRLVL